MSFKSVGDSFKCVSEHAKMEEDEGLEGKATCSPVKESNFLIYFIPFIAPSCLDFLMAVAAACFLVISFGYPSSL